MELKNFILVILLIAVILIIVVICYRNYAYNYCKNDMRCIEDKLKLNLFNLNGKLNQLKNNINININQEEQKQEEQIEGFFSGLGSWFSGSNPTNLPVAPGSLQPENLMTLESKINDKNIPSKEINGNSDDFYDSDNADLIGAPFVQDSNTAFKKSPSIQNSQKIQSSAKSIKEINISDSLPVTKQQANIKDLLGKCQFFDGKCPDNYVQLGNFSLHGVSSNSVLSCGNVQNTKPAKAVAQIKNNSIYEIHVLDQGHGFNPDSPPKINIEGGNGHGATAEAIVDESGFLKSIKIINPGYNYSDTPNVLIDAPLMSSSCHLCCQE